MPLLSHRVHPLTLLVLAALLLFSALLATKALLCLFALARVCAVLSNKLEFFRR